MEKIVFIDVGRESVMVEEFIIGGVDFSSRASTAAAHTPDIWTRPDESSDKFPPSELEDIKHEIEEDIKEMEADSRSEMLEKIEVAGDTERDLAEEQEEAREEMYSESNDKEAEEIVKEDEERMEEAKQEINIGDDLESFDAHGKTEPDPDPDPGSEENNNTEKNDVDRKEEDTAETA